MIHTISIWLLAAAFLGAGLVNAIGTSATRSDFAQWGYPSWWGRFTGALEVMSAVLIALPAARIVGLALGAAIIAAAILTVLRHRAFKHLVPLGVFVAVIALAGISTLAPLAT
jgi:DoxX-like family